MKALKTRIAVVMALITLASVAVAGSMDRPIGIKIGSRMTLKPYVAASAGYDSNVDGNSEGSDDFIWTLNPGLGLEYKAEKWMLIVNMFYQYNMYSKNQSMSQNSYHGYGEDITYRWSNSLPGERGWSLMITEKFNRINQNEDLNTSDGRGYGRDREELKVAVALQRRFANKIHADLNGSYFWLDYDNNRKHQASSLYGWSRWLLGAEIGWAPSQWTDILLAASYQGYRQENTSNHYYEKAYGNQRLSASSQGYTLQAGLGTYATDRIYYRLLGGWSRFEYGGSHGKASNGFTYTVVGNWKISNDWNAMTMATSYYQPTEREYGSSQRVDAFSLGLAHTMVRRKLSATLDVAYRRESQEYSAANYSYDLDILSFRLGLNYILNRYITFFGNAEYRITTPSGGDDRRADYYDYDRFRATIGIRFTY